jgi:hypothetical protein
MHTCIYPHENRSAAHAYVELCKCVCVFCSSDPLADDERMTVLHAHTSSREMCACTWVVVRTCACVCVCVSAGPHALMYMYTRALHARVYTCMVCMRACACVIYKHTHTHMHTYIHKYINTYVCVRARVCVCIVCICIQMRARPCTQVPLCLFCMREGTQKQCYVCERVRVCACVCVRVYTCNVHELNL